MTDVTIAVSIISKKFWNQFVKDISFDILYGILDYILNDTTELDLRLTVFYDYITELLEFYKVLKEDI